MNRLKKILFLEIIALLILASRAFAEKLTSPQNIYKNVNCACYVGVGFEAGITDTVKNSTSTINIDEFKSGSCVAVTFKGKIHILTVAHVISITTKEISEVFSQKGQIFGENKKNSIIINRFSPKIKIYFKNKPQIAIPATLTDIDENLDLAILRPTDKKILKKLKGLRLGKESQIKIGDEVINIGSPQDFQFIFMMGRIAQFLDISKNGETYKFILTSPIIDQGSSGSPLLNRKGELIGIARAAYFDYHIPFGLFIHVRSIKNYLLNFKQ